MWRWYDCGQSTTRRFQKELFIVPSEMDLAAIEIELAQRENYLMQLKDLLSP